MSEKSRAKILIVDDHENNLIALEHVLSELPTDIMRATSGEQALALVTEFEFAVVILDVQMPGMDGFETAELMRKNHHTQLIPIIFVTAINKEKMHVFKGYEAGAVDYLFKPVDSFLLKSKVQIFLDIYYQKTQRLVSLLRELQAVKLELENNNRELALIASQDSLTSLPNRRQFEEELTRSMSYAKRYNVKFAIIFLDIDNFKLINDNFGHAKGDELLKLSAKKILSQLRQEDFVARLGGDEFAIILMNLTSYQNAGKIAESIRDIFQQPLQIDGSFLDVTVSIGIACYPIAGDTVEMLTKNADIAMYRAKASGKNAYQFFSSELSREYTHRATVEKALQEAMFNNEFYMVYQVVYNLKTKKPAGVEALLRWHHPRLGDVSPADFIPLSEEMGLINKIGEWVIQVTCQQFSQWAKQGYGKYQYAINLSPRQLQQSALLESMKKCFAESKLDPRLVTLELTETAIMDNARDAELMLKKLCELGIKFSIDDFGTGYSSLIRLRNLPITTLKIDQSFVRDVIDDKNDAIIVKAILSLANSLGLDTVAEGIEKKEQLQFLLENGCQKGQGFYMSRPKSAEEVTVIFNKEGSRED